MIHPTAIVEDSVQLGQDCRIGPYAHLAGQVRLGDRVVIQSHAVADGAVTLEEGVELGHHAVVTGHTRIGARTRIAPCAVIGEPPQHLGYKGEPTRVEVGRDCQIREHVTIHRGTEAGGGVTRVGDHVMLMAYCHVAHDCQLGDHVIMANAATLGGHVEIQDHVFVGGLTAIHQFARVGSYAFVGGASAVSLDVIPFVSAAGNRAEVSSINKVGLQRNGFSKERIREILTLFRVVFRAGLRLEEALTTLEQEHADNDDARLMADFIRHSKRGICRLPGSRH